MSGNKHKAETVIMIKVNKVNKNKKQRKAKNTKNGAFIPKLEKSKQKSCYLCVACSSSILRTF